MFFLAELFPSKKGRRKEKRWSMQKSWVTKNTVNLSKLTVNKSIVLSSLFIECQEDRTMFVSTVTAFSYSLWVLKIYTVKKKKFASVTCNGSKFQADILKIFTVV